MVLVPLSPIQLIIVLFLGAFVIITIIALIFSFRKRGMEIVLKKSFMSGKPEDIKNKVLESI